MNLTNHLCIRSTDISDYDDDLPLDMLPDMQHQVLHGPSIPKKRRKLGLPGILQQWGTAPAFGIVWQLSLEGSFRRGPWPRNRAWSSRHGF